MSLRGVEIPVGTVVHQCYGAANRDPWLEDGRLLPAESPPELRPALEAYLRNRVPPLRADPLDPERRALLRALGYLAPE